jgi:hypothetical protein
MTGWLDPPHERVRLTVKELQALETLERSLARADAGAGPDESTSSRRQAIDAWLRAAVRAVAALGRTWSWSLLPLGLAVICLGLVQSLAFGVLGTLMVGAGLGVMILRARASITPPGR